MTVAAAAGKRRRLRNRGTGNGLAAANRHAAFKVDAFRESVIALESSIGTEKRFINPREAPK